MKNATARRRIGSMILSATDGLIGTATNFVLLQLYVMASIGGVKTMGDANRMAEDVHDMLDTFNYKTIKQTIYQLTKQGLIERPKKYDRTTIAITKLGKQRIKELIPTYKTDRPWDSHVYLVSYDIPTHHNRSRDILREYIHRTGGALLQESLWINPYNPSLLLRTFMDDHEIPGTVLISKLGSDGTIGDETLPDLIIRVYHLDKLTERYEEFLETYRKQPSISKTKCSIDYLAILKDDPQLPFPLLPKDFPAEKAWERYRKLMKS
ncbi:MAG: PaaX family transcriptional regulator C-terminal domain-containing protein [Candidatus Gottesmanbacteria bacterium]|nr:PaaX family transcriptional regulator C-terminal domain-containing protein [Candidatus Gottesmanbacteria bacterium]